MKQQIQDFFIKIDDDKFTKVKYIKANHSIKLNYKGLSFYVEYRRKNEVEKLYFIFKHFHKETQLNLRNAILYMILDDDKTIALTESSEYNYKEVAEFNLTTIQIEVNIQDFISIVNATKFEYSLRCDDGKIDGLFLKKDKFYLQGFYNATFDDEFELTTLSKFVENAPSDVNIWDLNTAIMNEKQIIVIEPLETLKRIATGLHKWENPNISFKGELLFGWSPNGSAIYITNIFTTEGIYDKKGNFLLYESKPQFELRGGWLGKSLVDIVSDFSIDVLVCDNQEIDMLYNYINLQIAELEA